MKPLVIYHANCTDGFTAAWCFWNKFGHEYDYHAASYGSPLPDVQGRKVFIVDFSYPADLMIELSQRAESIVVLDHHKTAVEEHFKWYDKLHQACQCHTSFDMDRSGAMLAWDYLNPSTPAPPLVHLVQDRDLWQFKIEGTRAFHAYVNALPFTFVQFDLHGALKWGDPALGRAVATGELLLQQYDIMVRDAVQMTKRRCTIAGYDVPVANVPAMFASEAGNIMNPGEPFAATYYDSEGGRCYSLRSAPDGMDVSAIARLFGGGGHARAAGFKVPFDNPLSKL